MTPATATLKRQTRLTTLLAHDDGEAYPRHALRIAPIIMSQASEGSRRRRATFVVGCDGDDGCPMCARDSSEDESEGEPAEE